MATSGLTPNMQSGLGELFARLRFVLLAILIYRIGTHIPVPGINPDRLAELFEQNSGTILAMFNMFSGGALERMSILALGIMPYISASIIMQLMSAVSTTLSSPWLIRVSKTDFIRAFNGYQPTGRLILRVVIVVA